MAFDHHGYSSCRRLLLHHTTAWAGEYREGWNCAMQRVEFDLLATSDLNARKMLSPDQYLHDPIPRAEAFIQRFDHACAAARTRRRHS